MEVEGEINNFIIVWTVAAASLCYCHTIGKLIPKGTLRLIFLLPVILLFLLLPLRLTSIILGGPSAFFLSWLSTFKLFLFAFGKGPLSPTPPLSQLSLSHFIPLACLPIRFHQFQIKPKKSHKSKSLVLRMKLLVLLTSKPVVENKERMNQKLALFLYSIYMYIALEIILNAVSVLITRMLFLGAELDPPFDEPYMATSLQDFWGRRWNTTVNRILHPTVYDPVLGTCSLVIGRRWAPLPAIVATFMVSGLMHELIFYYIKREKRTWEAWEPTWEATWFFLLHGVCLAVEVAIKKATREKWRLPAAVSGLMAAAFVMATGLWLFVPSLDRCRVDVKAWRECAAFIEFVKNACGFLRFSCFSVIIKR
ncbi:acyl-CoA--sterol O-acyltransferase 1-like [Prosopis cineraria]|uniref:acyl-CoA--sterol O-acyltransferase 1-like n=1 Tax=Prosopis cineraria TaxID=364024 RepID=UPI002410A2D7|nr:acyl-CoA--sterol O-acyltransferase 1-like [Prosopis cineraria]